jgi:putative Mg2+ transporter-C (MgtC) family protein
VKGIKAVAAVWITGAIGLAIGTSYWWLGIVVGLVTTSILFIADRFSDPVREVKQAEETNERAVSGLGKTKS